MLWQPGATLVTYRLGYPSHQASSWREKVTMSTLASTGLELESEPNWKGKHVTSTLWQVLVHDVRLSDVG